MQPKEVHVSTAAKEAKNVIGYLSKGCLLHFTMPMRQKGRCSVREVYQIAKEGRQVFIDDHSFVRGIGVQGVTTVLGFFLSEIRPYMRFLFDEVVQI